MAVTEQVVGVQAAAGGGRVREAHNPPASPAPGNIGAEPLSSAGVGGRAPGTPLGHTLTELTDTLPSNHLTHLQTQNQIICCPRETPNIKGIQRPSLSDHSPSPSPTQPPRPGVTSGVAEEAKLSASPPRAPTPSQLGAVLSGASSDSQGPQLGHVVEAGHRDGGDVVVVQGPEWGGTKVT